MRRPFSPAAKSQIENARQIGFVEQDVRRPAQLQTAQIIEPTRLLVTDTVLYTAKAEEDFWITHLWASNTGNAPADYSLHWVPSGGSVSADNAMVWNRTLGAGGQEVVFVAINQRMAPGSQLVALCSVADAILMGGWGYDQLGEPA